MAADRVGILLPPPVYPLLGLAASYGLELALPLPRLPWVLRVGGVVLAVSAIAFAVWAVVTLVRHHTPLDPYRPTTAIVDRGPYAASRNPIYVAFVFGMLGIGVAADWLWAAPLAPLVLLALHVFVVRKEERYLGGKFGDEYADYRRRVHRWI
jgi:protein-S-isoprenylcysteine O-methyltransferase Ste14